MCSHETGATFDSLEITRAFKLISLSHLASAENVGFCEKTLDPMFFTVKLMSIFTHFGLFSFIL